MTGGPHIFYFAPQHRAVIAMLEGLGCFPHSANLHPVTYPQQLAGLRPGCTFVKVTNHRAKLPREIDEAIRVYGLIEVTISNEWLRARHRGETPLPHDPSYDRLALDKREFARLYLNDIAPPVAPPDKERH